MCCVWMNGYQYLQRWHIWLTFCWFGWMTLSRNKAIFRRSSTLEWEDRRLADGVSKLRSWLCPPRCILILRFSIFGLPWHGEGQWYLWLVREQPIFPPIMFSLCTNPLSDPETLPYPPPTEPNYPLHRIVRMYCMYCMYGFHFTSQGRYRYISDGNRRLPYPESGSQLMSNRLHYLVVICLTPICRITFIHCNDHPWEVDGL